MTEPTDNRPPVQLEDERKNPVFRFGQAVAGFMLVVWAGVLALVFFLVFRFWLS
ncbi:membrane protein [Bergeriella denitrificans]|uniref:Membrane protein n=2 Tax=Bergeriella denitrificans TaxID=494 RepID=A0A378UDK3_BERDE|nr:membrane protein [Bergeriella denitrificans]